MTFGIPELIREILKNDCKVEMEPLDANFVNKLITHLHAPDKEIDIDIHSIGGERIKVEVWGLPDDMGMHPYAQAPCPLKNLIFDMNNPNFVESLTEFLLEYFSGSIVKIRFQRRKDVDKNNDKNNDKNKAEGSPK